MTLILGNCNEKLKELATASVAVVYLDPPFFNQKGHSLRARDNQNEYSFADKWETALC
jgi:site-specific DNA-methyltransferase (adenine-specific)